MKRLVKKQSMKITEVVARHILNSLKFNDFLYTINKERETDKSEFFSIDVYFELVGNIPTGTIQYVSELQELTQEYEKYKEEIENLISSKINDIGLLDIYNKLVPTQHKEDFKENVGVVDNLFKNNELMVDVEPIDKSQEDISFQQVLVSISISTEYEKQDLRKEVLLAKKR